MARILIFYSPFGSGHLSASKSLAAAFRHLDPQHIVVVEDIFEHIAQPLRSAVSTLYERLSERRRCSMKFTTNRPTSMSFPSP